MFHMSVWVILGNIIHGVSVRKWRDEYQNESTRRNKQNNRLMGKKTAENRRRIGNTWRLENSRNALWTQKQNGYFVTAAADEQWCVSFVAFWRTRARWGPPPSIHPPSTGGGIDIAARLRFLIAHKWDRTGRRPLRWVGATIVIPCRADRRRPSSLLHRRRWRCIQREIGNWVENITNKKNQADGAQTYFYLSCDGVVISSILELLCPPSFFFFLFCR